MKIIEKTAEKLKFVEEFDETLANAIRRSAVEIPILAIDEVEIFKNDSVLYDEVLALRLGLVPFVNQKDLELIEDCTCKGKGCSKCSIEMKLVKKGPGIVLAQDLKGKAEVVYPNIPIVKLEEEQEIEIVVTLRLGKGKEHTKYSPGLVYYRNGAELEVIKEPKNIDKIAQICPHKVLKNEKGKLILTDKYKCDLCEACVEECKKENDGEIKINPNKELIFIIESWGQIKAEEIMTGAVKALQENLKLVEKAIK